MTDREDKDERAQREEENDAFVRDLQQIPAELPEIAASISGCEDFTRLLHLEEDDDDTAFRIPDFELTSVPNSLGKQKQIS